MDDGTIEYWKEKYEDLNMQYDEFQKHSYEFENELEIQLKQSENEIKELQNRNNRLNNDNDTLKAKLNELNVSTHRQISQLQEELAKFKAVKDEMQKYIRELEQKNDNLEQTNRCAMFSLGEFEAKMNEALERNAILQIEMEEKDDLAETVQRLRDETRDLKQELAVRQRANQSIANLHNSHLSSKNANDSVSQSTVHSSNQQKHMNQMETTAIVEQEAKAPMPSSTLNTILNELNLQQQQQHTKTSLLNGFNNFNQQSQPNPVTASIRISALNFVGDALRKVTSMESRLVAARNLMKEGNRDRRSATISTIDSASYNTGNNVVNAKSSVPTNKTANLVANPAATVNVY